MGIERVGAEIGGVLDEEDGLWCEEDAQQGYGREQGEYVALAEEIALLFAKQGYEVYDDDIAHEQVRHNTKRRPKAEQEQIDRSSSTIQVPEKVQGRCYHAEHAEDIGRDIEVHFENDHVGAEQ